METIYIIAKPQYGSVAYYPDCIKSRALAAIAGTKTLTVETIKHAKTLGFSVKAQVNVADIEAAFDFEAL